jgi:hypothetical protein
MGYIGRSVNTGKYHYAYGPNVTACNHSGQRKNCRNAPASDDHIAKAAPDMFCKKCFPNGKPEAAA